MTKVTSYPLARVALCRFFAQLCISKFFQQMSLSQDCQHCPPVQVFLLHRHSQIPHGGRFLQLWDKSALKASINGWSVITGVQSNHCSEHKWAIRMLWLFQHQSQQCKFLQTTSAVHHHNSTKYAPSHNKSSQISISKDSSVLLVFEGISPLY